ncbi:MAG: hypothetical protein K2Z81_28025 [Cyanobacteria bacterium]|nr:hypothetical protein [Cyanobacteriota bacterium]
MFKQYSNSITKRLLYIKNDALDLSRDLAQMMIFTSVAVGTTAAGEIVAFAGIAGANAAFGLHLSLSTAIKLSGIGGGIGFLSIQHPKIERPLWRAIDACDNYFRPKLR